MILIYFFTVAVVGYTYFVFRTRMKNHYAKAFFDSNYYIVALFLLMEGINNIIPAIIENGDFEVTHHSIRSFAIVYLLILAFNMNSARKKTINERKTNNE